MMFVMPWNHTSNLVMAYISHFAIILSFDDQCDSSTMFVTCIAFHDQNLIIVIMLLTFNFVKIKKVIHVLGGLHK
jgi:hypothetical protein